MKIISESNNKLLTSNLGIDLSLQKLSEHFKEQPENIVVRGVNGHFGRHDFLIDAFIYDSVEQKNLIERKPKVKKAVSS